MDQRNVVGPQFDANGQMLASNARGINTALNISVATVVKATPGRTAHVSVITAGTTVGTINDCTTTAAAAAANQVATIPFALGVVYLDWPHAAGIVVVPGTGQVLAVNYD